MRGRPTGSFSGGSLHGRTHEVLLGAVLASKKDFLWRLNFAGVRTRQTVTALSVPPYLVGPVANTTIFRLAPGERFGIVYGGKWVRTAEQLGGMIANRRLTGTARHQRASPTGASEKSPCLFKTMSSK